jgi:hypothetical protein
MRIMMEDNPLSDTKRWLQGLVQAGEAALQAAENCPEANDPASEVGMIVASQRDLVRGEVVKFRAKLASATPVRQIAKTFAVTFDRRYWKQGTFVYPLHVFHDPEHRFSAEQVQQVQALKVGETVDLADGRVVQRQE